LPGLLGRVLVFRAGHIKLFYPMASRFKKEADWTYRKIGENPGYTLYPLKEKNPTSLYFCGWREVLRPKIQAIK